MIAYTRYHKGDNFTVVWLTVQNQHSNFYYKVRKGEIKMRKVSNEVVSLTDSLTGILKNEYEMDVLKEEALNKNLEQTNR